MAPDYGAGEGRVLALLVVSVARGYWDRPVASERRDSSLL